MTFDQYKRQLNENLKFVETGGGEVAVRVVGSSGSTSIDVTSTATDMSAFVGKASGTNADFTTAYASGTTITLSGLPSGVSAINADDIVSVEQYATDGALTKRYTRDDVAFTASGTDPTTLTVTGATFAATDTFVVYTSITRNVQGNIAHDAVDSGNPVKIGGKAASSQATAVAAGDRVNASFNLYSEQVIAGYDWSSQTNKTTETDPLDTHYVTESLVDTTNLAADTYYYQVNMATFKDLSFSGKFIDADETVTMTIEATNDEDTSAGDWIDVTKTFVDDTLGTTGHESFTVTNDTLTFAISKDNFNYKYARAVVITGGATNTIILKSKKKAL